MKRLGRVWLVGLVGLALHGWLADGAVAPVLAAGRPIQLARALPAFSWSAPQSMSLAGVAVRYQLFSSRLTVAETARRFADRTPLFQRVIASRNSMVLSGLHDGLHWVAEINAAGRGTRGTVSALPMMAPRDGQPSGTRVNTNGWLPVSAVLKFDQRVDVKKRNLIQRIYSVGLPAAQTSRHVVSRLTLSGWERIAWIPESGMQQWRRNNERMALSVRPDSGASILFVQFLR